MTLFCKKFTVTETKSIKNTTQTGETAVEAQMKLLAQSQRGADRSHRRPKQDKTRLYLFIGHTQGKTFKKDNTNYV